MNNDKNKYGGLKVEMVYTSDAIKDLLQDLEHKKIAIQNRNARIKELEAQIEKMKCDVLSLIKDGKDTDLAIDKPVYAIHLTDIREM